VGDSVGVGPMVFACGKCDPCTHGTSNVCDRGYVQTYNDNWRSTGEPTYGGYADKWR
jgi:uncharacterized zinc-type alcohol dehydrogenase-like protein